MLALDRPRDQSSSYLDHLPMDPSSLTFLDPLNAADDHHQQLQFHQHHQGLFDTYSCLPSDPYPFILQPDLGLGSPLVYSKNEPISPLPTSYLPSRPSENQNNNNNNNNSSSSGPSSVSSHSVPSATSSSIGSPFQDRWLDMDQIDQERVPMPNDAYSNDFLPAGVDSQFMFTNDDKFPDCFGESQFLLFCLSFIYHRLTLLDPSLLQQQPDVYSGPPTTYPEENQYTFIPSPAFTSATPASPLHHHQPDNTQFYMNQPTVPNKNNSNNNNNTLSIPARRSSISSIHSRRSPRSPLMPGHPDGEDDVREKGSCPHHGCGRVFRDLKAHMLTHQQERPEKCPISNCEYHHKGFARKYDKNRHTLTHYKGTMVCGFCPGSGSAAEKSFNRADVFKRHLTSVHGVDQSAPNGRKRTPPTAAATKLSSYCQDATGKCSTCSATFNSAQEFYEHLDECVLHVVQQTEPSEAINFKHLKEVAQDEAVRDTMERHMLVDPLMTANDYADENTNQDADNNNNNIHQDSSSTDQHALHHSNSGKGSIKSTSLVKPTAAGPGGVNKGRSTASRRRNNRNNYPPSWGRPTNKMKMKRRLLCLYDGQRRLWKDEMMLDNAFEVRLKLPGGDGMGREAYVTDLDVETLKRTEGIHNATEEEKGPWMPGSAPDGLLGAPAVPVMDKSNEVVDEINIDDFMA